MRDWARIGTARKVDGMTHYGIWGRPISSAHVYTAAIGDMAPSAHVAGLPTIAEVLEKFHLVEFFYTEFP